MRAVAAIVSRQAPARRIRTRHQHVSMVDGQQLGVVADPDTAVSTGAQHGGGVHVRAHLRGGGRTCPRLVVGRTGVQVDADRYPRMPYRVAQRRPESRRALDVVGRTGHGCASPLREPDHRGGQRTTVRHVAGHRPDRLERSHHRAGSSHGTQHGNRRGQVGSGERTRQGAQLRAALCGNRVQGARGGLAVGEQVRDGLRFGGGRPAGRRRPDGRLPRATRTAARTGGSRPPGP